jgi:glucose-6-phosphate 1-epimerase
MAEPLSSTALFQGQPSLTLCHPCGDALQVLLHGAHIVSWQVAGRERFYLSPRSIFDGRSAIRGGVPVCFPQFNQRGSLPKHGFARNLAWVQDGDAQIDGEAVRLSLRLSESEATRAYWAQAFQARLTVELTPNRLQITLSVHNTDAQDLEFSGALHSYFAVDDIASTSLEGLGAQTEWDAVRDVHGQGAARLVFESEFDRVYAAAPRPLTLRSGAQTLQITQSPSWAHTVVWNPGATLAAKIPDLGPDEHRHMLCVEAAQVLEPIRVPAGAVWEGWQALKVL